MGDALAAMTSLAHILTALALLAPVSAAAASLPASNVAAANVSAPVGVPSSAPMQAPAATLPPVAPQAAQAGETPKFPKEIEYPVAGRPAPIGTLKVTVNQSRVRVQGRVYVRIAPRSVAARRNLLAQLPVRARPQRYEEKKAKKCVRVEEIAGVETGSGNRLLLFLRDANILSVNLEKACRARDFYAGFYVKSNEDGRLCVERDTLQSRNGARCDIARMMKLEAIEE